MLGIEGEAPASYNSLNDTNYLEQLVEGDADILLAYAELDKLDKNPPLQNVGSASAAARVAL